jgi:hypothetical protein
MPVFMRASGCTKPVPLNEGFGLQQFRCCYGSQDAGSKENFLIALFISADRTLISSNSVSAGCSRPFSTSLPLIIWRNHWLEQWERAGR